MSNPRRLLKKTLLDLFPSAWELSQFLEDLDHGVDLVRLLPDPAVGSSRYAAGATDQLISKGYVDADLIAALKSTFTQEAPRRQIDEVAAAFGLAGSRPTPMAPPIDAPLTQPLAPYLLERMYRLDDAEIVLVRQHLQWRGVNTSTVPTGAISTQAIGFIQRCEDLPGGLEELVDVLETVRPGLVRKPR